MSYTDNTTTFRRAHTTGSDIYSSPSTSSEGLKRRVSGGMVPNHDSHHAISPQYNYNSQEASASNGYHHPSTFSPYKPYNGGKSSRTCSFFLSLLAIIGLSCALVYGKMQYDQVQQELQLAQQLEGQMKESHMQLLLDIEQAKRSQNTDSQWLKKIDGMRAETRNLEQQLDLEEMVKQEAKRELELANGRYENVMEKSDNDLDRLQGNIQDMARMQIIEKFGPGPHYVQFEVDLHMGQRQYFTVQLASLDYMPTAVYYFLQQSAKQLWDNTSFYLNAGHVLMARPTSGDGQVSKRGEFAKQSLHHLPFSEYHENQPHVKYTLGYSGRPSGPDFYINMVDNTIVHGPSGHRHSGAAEPCFGTIVVGFEVIDQFVTPEGKPKETGLLSSPMDIVSVKVLRDLSEAVKS